MSSPILAIEDVVKGFPGVVALDGVRVDFFAGTCHALMGENGAGKSTLGKLIAGIYSPDRGRLLLDGAEVHFKSPHDAVEAGIAIVHQELLFAENLTVAENLNLAELPHRGLFLDRRLMFERASRWLELIGANIDPDTRIGDLPVSRQQLVQIAGALGKGARILIFDEPTSSLSKVEASRLMGTIRELKSRGVTCIYVSHRLEEVFEICDTVTVLRDGKLVGTRSIDSIDRDELVRMMVGRELAADLESGSLPAEVGEEVLRVEGLCSPGKLDGVSFSLRRGEILGFAGLVGAGRTEVVEALFGLDPHARGDVFVGTEVLKVSGPTQAMRAGFGLIPEDRKRHGLVLSMNIRENVSLPVLDWVTALGVVRPGVERGLVQTFFERLRVKAPGIESSSVGLSGGNQQKLVIAKWLAADADILLIDEPTRGVDVGAKAEIHELIRGLARDGKAVLLVSSDLPELLALSTRVVILRGGRLVGEVARGAGEEVVMRGMAGVS